MSTFAQRNYTFRGKTLDDLKAMELKDFIELLNSRRQRWFGRSFSTKHVKLIQKVQKSKDSVVGQTGVKPPVVRTHLRGMVIIPAFVDGIIGIYNGKEFVEVLIKPEMIGHVFADFSMAKAVVKHSKAGVGATRGSSATSLK